MLRWLVVVVLALLLVQGLHRWLERFGFGRLPGDFEWRWRGKRWSLPIASCLLLSLIALAIGELL